MPSLTARKGFWRVQLRNIRLTHPAPPQTRTTSPTGRLSAGPSGLPDLRHIPPTQTFSLKVAKRTLRRIFSVLGRPEVRSNPGKVYLLRLLAKKVVTQTINAPSYLLQHRPRSAQPPPTCRCCGEPVVWTPSGYQYNHYIDFYGRWHAHYCEPKT